MIAVIMGNPAMIDAYGSDYSRRRKTDLAIIVKLNGAVEEVINDPAVQKALQTIGFDPIHRSSSEADAYFKSEVAKWGGMVKELGLAIN